MAKDNSDNKSMTAAANTTIKKTGRGGRFNFESTVDPETEDKDTIRAVLTETLQWYDRGQDRPTTDEQIYNRSREYLQSCIDRGQRPTVENYCLALGYARTTVNEWKNGNNCGSDRMNIIKNAFDCFAAFDAGMATTGKLNPILYFFRAKNFYSMRDQQELVIEPKQGITDENAMNVAEKYAQLPAD